MIDNDDGTYTIHQSWLNTYFNCPELARREMLGLVGHQETDATAIGTGLHAGVEHHLRTGSTYHEALKVAQDAFVECMKHPDARWVQAKNGSTALRYIDSCLQAWWSDIRPRVGRPVAIEESFKVQLTDRIWLGGTIDYVDDLGLIWDWKTANDADKYGRKAWEIKRWSVQPTAYTFAWCELTGETAPFIFAATLKGATPRPAQMVLVERGPAEWQWLAHQLEAIVDMREQQGVDAPWPMRDQHVLCSPKWCPAWDVCKGSLVTLP